MWKSFGGMTIFIVILCGGFIYIGYVVTKLSGEKASVTAVTGVSPEVGEVIFWGKGQCHTCHSIGTQGSGIRGPNLEGIAEMAVERSNERVAQGKAGMTPTGYLIEALSFPDAYVVKGYKPEMPFVYKPPIALSPDEVKAVIAYLQTQGGEVNIDEISLPPEVAESSKVAEAATEWAPYVEGDPVVGENLFFDVQSEVACAKCHTVKERGGKVGPELTTVAATRSPQYIIESILKPSAVIASGFEPVKVKTKKGKIITGVLKEEKDTGVTIMDNEGNLIQIGKEDIKKLSPMDTSIMPSFGNIIKMDDFHNLLAYLLTLK